MLSERLIRPKNQGARGLHGGESNPPQRHREVEISWPGVEAPGRPTLSAESTRLERRFQSQVLNHILPKPEHERRNMLNQGAEFECRGFNQFVGRMQVRGSKRWEIRLCLQVWNGQKQLRIIKFDWSNPLLRKREKQGKGRRRRRGHMAKGGASFQTSIHTGKEARKTLVAKYPCSHCSRQHAVNPWIYRGWTYFYYR